MSARFFNHELANGLRIVVERMDDVRSSAAGFLCRTGSRDETPDVAGVSHFLEHMCFKGTAHRSATDINIDFDRIGGQPNAFTSHDRTFYYSVTRAADLDKQIDILADMMRSVLPPDEFAMEKKVVLEEIAQSNDRIEHVAFDVLIEELFKGHPLGWPVLGYERTIDPLTRDQMHAYFQSRYAPDNMVLVAAGAVDPDELVALAEKHCDQWQPGASPSRRTVPTLHSGRVTRRLERFNQQVIALTYPAPSGISPLHETGEALAIILGGNNSRFFWAIEQEGLCPHAAAYRLDFSDCGLLILLAQCDPDKAEAVETAMRTEAKRIMTDSVTPAEIQRVRNKRRTSLAVEGESPYHRLVQVMDDVDYRGQPRTVEQRLAAVDAVGRESLAEYFASFPIDGEGLFVSVGPRAA
ncbi:MAG TPA: pitrilysin family protein [Phycisphaerae bacterium]|nr:insulinase family protein [Phycisphaerales bacterium]HRX85221.1 pitrilysin family protein [Phycisphaerae bacterium]